MLEQTIATLVHYLGQMDLIFSKLEIASKDKPNLLDARLAPDMMPLAQQASTAIQFSLRVVCPLMPMPIPHFISKENTFKALRAQLHSTQCFLRQLEPQQAEVPHYITSTAGFNELHLPPKRYVNEYGLPNFFFHLSMLYATARQQGVGLAKGDFDGFHQYPENFSFQW